VPRFFSIRFAKFLVVGGSCTLLDFVLFSIIHLWLKVDIVLANIVSYGVGLTASFFLNRAWTFHDGQLRSKKRILHFFLWGYGGLILNTGLVWFLANYIHSLFAKSIAVIVVLLYNYLANKYFVFKV
jgi:putative flippase GtrA